MALACTRTSVPLGPIWHTDIILMALRIHTTPSPRFCTTHVSVRRASYTRLEQPGSNGSGHLKKKTLVFVWESQGQFSPIWREDFQRSILLNSMSKLHIWLSVSRHSPGAAIRVMLILLLIKHRMGDRATHRGRRASLNLILHSDNFTLTISTKLSRQSVCLRILSVKETIGRHPAQRASQHQRG